MHSTHTGEYDAPYSFVLTSTLEIAYLEWNPNAPRTAVLLHGWPDSPMCWSAVAQRLVAAGYRVLAPALRGFAPTRFLDAGTPRSGQLAALGRDLVEFIDAMALMPWPMPCCASAWTPDTQAARAQSCAHAQWQPPWPIYQDEIPTSLDFECLF